MKAVITLLALLGLTAARPQFQQFQQPFRQAVQPFRQPVQPFRQPVQPFRQPVQPFQQAAQPFQQAARQVVQGPVAYILRYDANLGLPTGFSYAVETSDGFNKAEIGDIKNEGTDDEALAVEGQYSYVGDDGQTYAVHYTADENGFRPSGEHIPPAASTSKKLGIPSAALASLAGGGLG